MCHLVSSIVLNTPYEFIPYLICIFTISLSRKSTMELPDVHFNKSEYIETASGNRVSRASVLCGSQNIILNGKNIVQSEAIIRGDLANVRVGRHCIISSKAVIR